jgi:plasmid stabilization system protein ParE
MKYEVLLSPRALRDLERAYQWLLERTEQHAPKWHDEALEAIESLDENPERCPLAPESKKQEVLRQLLFGDKRHAYRIVFAIRDDKVWVVHITHGARASEHGNEG